MILKWVNYVDLYRYQGRKRSLCRVVRSSWLDTVPELATRNPKNLHAKILEVIEEKRIYPRNRGTPLCRELGGAGQETASSHPILVFIGFKLHFGLPQKIIKLFEAARVSITQINLWRMDMYIPSMRSNALYTFSSLKNVSGGVQFSIKTVSATANLIG